LLLEDVQISDFNIDFSYFGKEKDCADTQSLYKQVEIKLVSRVFRHSCY